MSDDLRQAVVDWLNSAFFQPAAYASAGILGTVALQALRRRKSRLLLRRRTFFGDQAIVTETHYQNAPHSNYQEQFIRNYNTVDLETIYPKEIWPVVSRYLSLAKKQCTLEEPLVFMHLDKVLPKNDGERIKEAIFRHWVTYFSGTFNSMQSTYLLNGGDAYQETRVYPLLMFEPGAQQRQLRIFLIDNTQLREGYKLDPHSTIIKGTTYNPSKPHPQFERLCTIRHISRLYNKHVITGIMEHICVGVKATSSIIPLAPIAP